MQHELCPVVLHVHVVCPHFMKAIRCLWICGCAGGSQCSSGCSIHYPVYRYGLFLWLSTENTVCIFMPAERRY